MSSISVLHPEIDFPFQRYDAKIPSNRFRIGRVISQVQEEVIHIQEKRVEVEGITIDGNENTFLHDDGIKIEKNSQGYLVQVSVIDTPEYIIPVEKLFMEVLKRLETAYMHRYISFMLPKTMIDILSLQEGKIRPSITIELQFNNEGEVVGDTNIFRSYFKNVKNFTDKTFSRELVNFGAPFHDVLHVYGDFGRMLYRKRIGNGIRNTSNTIPLYELIVSEIVQIINKQIAKFSLHHTIPISFAHRLNGDFRYSTHENPNEPYTRISCPGRRALDMCILGQITHFAETNGKEILFDENFFDDLSRYNNTRSPYIDEQSEQHKTHSETVKTVRRTKRFQKYPEQMSDEDIQYFFFEEPKKVDIHIMNEVKLRIEKNQLSITTLAYIFFSNVQIDRKIMENIYKIIRLHPNFGYFFRHIKQLSFVDFSIETQEKTKKVSYIYEITIFGRKMIKEGSYSISNTSDTYKTKSRNAGNKMLRKEIQEKIMQEYLKEIFKS